MAAIHRLGFELNSLAVNMEIFPPSGAVSGGAIVTSPVYSGTYAYQNKPSASAVSFGNVFAVSADALKTVFFRFYYYVVTHPASNSLVLSILDVSNATTLMRLRGTGSGLRAQNSGGTQVGSDFAVSTGTWHYIDIKLFSSAASGTIDVLLDGVSVVSVTGTGTGGQNIGCYLFGSGASLTHEYYIDDVGVNTSAADTLGTNTSYLGASKIVYLRPSSNDSAAWTPSAGSNFQCVDEITPNDATDYVSSVTLNQIDVYFMDTSALGSSDTIKVVCVGMRFANDVVDATTAMKLRAIVEPTVSTQESATLIASSTAWKTNGASVSYNPYPLIMDADPGGAAAWTKATLNNTAIGQKITAVGTNKLLVSAVWALVDYVQGVATLPSKSIRVTQAVKRAATY